MFRRINEKKETEKDETYYLQKIEELRKRSVANAKRALIVQEGSDEDGCVEVWSTDSKEVEVSKPTHGGCFVANSDLQEYEGRCLMVQNNVLKQRGYVTNGGQASENYFDVKPVYEQVKECEKAIDKVLSIL